VRWNSCLFKYICRNVIFQGQWKDFANMYEALKHQVFAAKYSKAPSSSSMMRDFIKVVIFMRFSPELDEMYMMRKSFSLSLIQSTTVQKWVSRENGTGRFLSDIYFYNILRQNITFPFISITTTLIGKILKAKFTHNSCLQENGEKSGLGNFF
jgi:hypothetical protein